MQGFIDIDNPMGYLIFMGIGAIIGALFFKIASVGVGKTSVRKINDNTEYLSWVGVTFVLLIVSILFYIFSEEIGLSFKTTSFFSLFLGYIFTNLAILSFYYKLTDNKKRSGRNKFFYLIFISINLIFMFLFTNDLILLLGVSLEVILFIFIILLIIEAFLIKKIFFIM